MDYINLFINGGQGKETKPAGTAMNISLNGNDKAVEPAQATKQQEPIPTYSQERKGRQKASSGLYRDCEALTPWRKSFAILEQWTKIPPGTLTDADIGNVVDQCNSLMEHGQIGAAMGDWLVTTLCVMQGVMKWEDVKGQGIAMKH